MSTKLNTQHIRASRKQYGCNWCGEKISVGESYVRWTCADEGTVYSFKIHPECDAAYHNAPRSVTDDIAEDFRYGEFKRGSFEWR